MLNRLIIKNIALIDALEVEFASGLNVLSGETGAGKSIIIDSVNLVLGERADRELIRTGTQTASVEAWFSEVHGVGDILDEQQIEADGELVLTRELTACFAISGCMVWSILVTLSMGSSMLLNRPTPKPAITAEPINALSDACSLATGTPSTSLLMERNSGLFAPPPMAYITFKSAPG